MKWALCAHRVFRKAHQPTTLFKATYTYQKKNCAGFFWGWEPLVSAKRKYDKKKK